MLIEEEINIKEKHLVLKNINKGKLLMINYGNEYKKYLKRKGRPYSDAHRSKYRVIAELLKDRPANILEIGPGTGWGLKRLLKKNCIKKYLGIEAVSDCVNFLNKQFKSHNNIKIVNKDWIDYPVKKIKEYFLEDKIDFVLCIEVIEHNPYDLSNYLNFLEKIQRLTKRNLFYSTPNREADSHGKLTHNESMELIKKAGFQSIGVVIWRGTPLYICNP